MRRGSAIVVLALGAILAGARQSDLPKPDVVVRGRYEAESGLKIEGVGVCSITPDQVDCWNLAGERDAALAERIRAYYLNSSYTDVGFRFGKKNRYLVFRRTSPSTSVQYQTDLGGHLSTQSVSGQQGEPVLEWARVAVEPETKEVAVLATVSVPGPPPLDIPFRRGVRRAYQGAEIEIGPWRSLPASRVPGREHFYPTPQGKLWSVVLGVESPQGGRAYQGYSVLNRDGKLIRYVDRKGEPVSDMDVLHSFPPGRNPGYYPEAASDSKYISAQFNPSGPSTGSAMAATTNINPARIGFLRLSLGAQRRVLIQGFPLDPKG